MDKRTDYIDEWQRANYRRVVLKLNKTADSDIINKLDSVDSVNGFIKEAIRAYITRTAGQDPQDD